MAPSFRDLSMIVSVMVLVTASSGCLDGGDGDEKVPVDPRAEMRELVGNISDYGKGIAEDLIMITQNGNELLYADEDLSVPDIGYMSSLDGISQEDLFYGYSADNEPTPADEREYLLKMLRLGRDSGLSVLVTDYCKEEVDIDTSYSLNEQEGFISIAATRELDRIPPYPDPPHNENADDVNELQDASNFLYLIDPGQFSDGSSYLDMLRSTNYDALIIDAFFDGRILTSEEVSSLKVKENGCSRLVISYMSIGEAEDYRYYWDPSWERDPPIWLDDENPDWEGNYKVKYWEPEWKDIIYGGPGAYLDMIIGAGFDGVFLDIIDAFEYYE